jgi:capsular exopolysaccharide synthesis family protein
MAEGNNEIKTPETHSLKDYISLARNNLSVMILITLASLVIAVLYAINAKDIYRSTTTLKVSKPQGSILNSPIMPEFQDFGNDRFIANEIEILKTYNTRERVSETLIDSFYTTDKKRNFYLIRKKESDPDKSESEILSVPAIAEMLQSYVSIDQKRGLDIIEISAESPAPFEAALIANCYAVEYRYLNLEVNRNQLTFVKNFLLEQKNEKQRELDKAEDTLRRFQEKGGIIALDEQATLLISQLSQFEAQKNATQIDLMASDRVLSQYKKELSDQNPRLADYLTGLSSEAYFKSLQEQLVKLEVNRDIALANKMSVKDNQSLIKEYEQKIRELKEKLNDRIETIKAGIFASSPTEVKELSQKIIEEEVKNQALKISVGELKDIVQSYESKFNKLPKTAIELARYQRNRESLEKLYTLVEEKYQEALINEQSQPGNVLIIDNARIPDKPSKPNRTLIIIVGLILGIGMAMGFIFIKNYFDNTVKTPEDIQKRNINVLGWIPQFDGFTKNGITKDEFVITKKPDSVPSESFRTLRTRIQFSRLDKNSLKTILVTSSAPQEGKTVVTVNLGASFAQSNRKTLILDCDLRKPRVHNLFNSNRIPGLIDYLFGEVSLNAIIHNSELKNLDYITCGTIPPNPAEMLESNQMREFLTEMERIYDVILLDSPPIITVTDSEVLASIVDGTILVVSSETTEIELMEKSIELIRKDKSKFIGTVLNNFSYKSGYSSYYKYYYYYSNSPGSKIKKSSKKYT